MWTNTSYAYRKSKTVRVLLSHLFLHKGVEPSIERSQDSADVRHILEYLGMHEVSYNIPNVFLRFFVRKQSLVPFDTTGERFGQGADESQSFSYSTKLGCIPLTGCTVPRLASSNLTQQQRIFCLHHFRIGDIRTQ